MNIFVHTRSTLTLNQCRPEAEIYCKLVELGHSVTVMTSAIPEQVKRFEEAGVKVIEGKTNKKISAKVIKAIRQELKKGSYDIVYACCSKTIPNAGFACIGLPVKFVAYRGTTGGLYRHDPTAYLTILHPRLDGVVCVSEAVREDVVQRVWKNKENVTTIHKGHELSWYEHPAANLSEFGIAKTDFTIICVCNVRPSKGIDIMIKATHELANVRNIHLLLVGKGLEQSPYKELINASPMKERIHLAGHRQDAPELITASDVLVQPSISGEGLPRAMMEAIGCKTPVVITTTGGGKEIIEDGISGYVVPVKDPKAITDRVMNYYNNPQIKEEFALAAQKRLKENFSTLITAQKFEKYFLGLLA